MDVGVTLLDRGLISPADLESARGEASASGERLDRVLVRSGRLAREQVLSALAEQFHMALADLPSLTVEPAVLSLVPAKFVFGRRCVPIAREGSRLTVATADPFDLSPADELRLLTGLSIEPVLADEEELHGFIRANYGVGGDTLDAMSAGMPEVQAGKGGVDAGHSILRVGAQVPQRQPEIKGGWAQRPGLRLWVLLPRSGAVLARRRSWVSRWALWACRMWESPRFSMR